MDVAHDLALHGDGNVDLAHARHAHGRRKVFGILHDLGLYAAQDVIRRRIAELRHHGEEEIRRRIRRKKVGNADAHPLHRGKFRPRIGHARHSTHIIAVGAEHDGIIPDARPCSRRILKGRTDRVRALRDVRLQSTVCRRLLQCRTIGEHEIRPALADCGILMQLLQDLGRTYGNEVHLHALCLLVSFSKDSRMLGRQGRIYRDGLLRPLPSRPVRMPRQIVRNRRDQKNQHERHEEQGCISSHRFPSLVLIEAPTASALP